MKRLLVIYAILISSMVATGMEKDGQQAPPPNPWAIPAQQVMQPGPERQRTLFERLPEDLRGEVLSYSSRAEIPESQLPWRLKADIATAIRTGDISQLRNFLLARPRVAQVRISEPYQYYNPISYAILLPSHFESLPKSGYLTSKLGNIIEVIQLLLKSGGIDINMPNQNVIGSYGTVLYTLFHFWGYVLSDSDEADKQAFITLLQFLLASGADPAIKAGKEKSIYVIAKEDGDNPQVQQLLIDYSKPAR